MIEKPQGRRISMKFVGENFPRVGFNFRSKQLFDEVIGEGVRFLEKY